MAYRYDNTTKEWRDYKAHLHQLQHLGYPRMFLEAVVAYERPQPLTLSSDELKQAAAPEAELQAATAAGDGYIIVTGVEAELQLAREVLGELEQKVPHKVDRVNATHNPDTPQTQEEIDAAWARHKAFFGR